MIGPRVGTSGGRNLCICRFNLRKIRHDIATISVRNNAKVLLILPMVSIGHKNDKRLSRKTLLTKSSQVLLTKHHLISFLLFPQLSIAKPVNAKCQPRFSNLRPNSFSKRLLILRILRLLVRRVLFKRQILEAQALICKHPVRIALSNHLLRKVNQETIRLKKIKNRMG